MIRTIEANMIVNGINYIKAVTGNKGQDAVKTLLKVFAWEDSTV
ncbi:MAG: hypothetical protein WKF37_01010 [Bryobacteraceae bacterium]